MTDEPPVRPGRPAAGAAARLAALLAEFDHHEGGPEVPDARASEPEPAPSGNGHVLSALRAQLAELTNPAPIVPAEPISTEVTDAAPAPEAVAVATPVPVAEAPAPPEAAPAPAVAEEPPAEAGVAEPATLPYVPLPPPAEPEGTRTRRRWDPRILYGLMAVLIIAIPILTVVGTRTVLDSRAGKVAARNLDPTAPGYLAIVEPTPTALLIQHDATGQPVSLTVLALGRGDAGGSVLFIPLDTNLLTPALFVDRLRTAFKQNGDAAVASVTGRLLGIGFNKVVPVGDAEWAQLVAPVSPLHIDNPVDMTLGASVLAKGPIDLPADEVAAYLAAQVEGQDDLDRLDRQQVVWRAWLKAISETGTATVPVTTNGLGPFITTLAAGPASMATLAVVPSATPAKDGTPTFDPQLDGILEQISDAVPSPISPGLDGRFSTKVLNGWSGQPIPDALVKQLVRVGAQVDALGNANHFGAEQTRIVYHSAKLKPKAQAVRSVLGGGKIIFDAETNDPSDVVIVLGHDALEHVAGG
ncbi:MAG: LCP family protein [Acidimicrobiia bacterium]|nr:LCP family protein [Acidimicrobiia bacterium]